ncbi:hypothetical protein [Dorea sp. D27]|uniref:hypothetical protein n=1 Tax=Dorea sp. D27 TaxID=658665 RepID=UPI0006739E9B|nr:hypothetical protein [Dorea sp. D27]KMZ55154.1 hypothetical protein HMPREF0980_00833 [Dorea sp. D27]
MAALLCAFGVCFVFKGLFMFVGRMVPRNVMLRLQDNEEQLKGWCHGTGTVHILWGICAVLIWCADRYSQYALNIMAAVITCAVISIMISFWTTYRYSNR